MSRQDPTDADIWTVRILRRAIRALIVSGQADAIDAVLAGHPPRIARAARTAP